MYNKNIVWLEADSYCTRVNFFRDIIYTNFKIVSNYFIQYPSTKYQAHEKYDIYQIILIYQYTFLKLVIIFNIIHILQTIIYSI